MCHRNPHRVLLALAVTAILLCSLLPAPSAAAVPPSDTGGAAASEACAVSVAPLWHRLLASLLSNVGIGAESPLRAGANTLDGTAAAGSLQSSGSDTLARTVSASDDGSKEAGPSLDPNGAK